MDCAFELWLPLADCVSKCTFRIFVCWVPVCIVRFTPSPSFPIISHHSSSFSHSSQKFSAWNEFFVSCFCYGLQYYTTAWNVQLYDAHILTVARIKRCRTRGEHCWIFHWFPFWFAAGTCWTRMKRYEYHGIAAKTKISDANGMGAWKRHEENCLSNENFPVIIWVNNTTNYKWLSVALLTRCFGIFNERIQAARWRYAMWKSWWTFNTLSHRWLVENWCTTI